MTNAEMSKRMPTRIFIIFVSIAGLIISGMVATSWKTTEVIADIKTDTALIHQEQKHTQSMLKEFQRDLVDHETRPGMHEP